LFYCIAENKPSLSDGSNVEHNVSQRRHKRI